MLLHRAWHQEVLGDTWNGDTLEGSPEIPQSGSFSPTRKHLSPQLVPNVSPEPSGKPHEGVWGGEKTVSCSPPWYPTQG